MPARAQLLNESTRSGIIGERNRERRRSALGGAEAAANSPGGGQTPKNIRAQPCVKAAPADQ